MLSKTAEVSFTPETLDCRVQFKLQDRDTVCLEYRDSKGKDILLVDVHINWGTKHGIQADCWLSQKCLKIRKAAGWCFAQELALVANAYARCGVPASVT